jgi:FixJ family two-component response regulator
VRGIVVAVVTLRTRLPKPNLPNGGARRVTRSMEARARVPSVAFSALSRYLCKVRSNSTVFTISCEVAPVLGVSEQTVKSHLHRLYEKTATRRQAELVKLVASYSARL